MATNSNRPGSARLSRSSSQRDGISERSVNVFGDEFAVEIADGFQPTTPDTNRQTTPRPTTPPRSSKPPQTDEAKSDAATRWAGASATQATPSRNSFTLANDSMEGPSRMSSTHHSDLSRRISTISSVSTAIPRAQSPFVGASAPSHPYAMYPQDTQLNRASTISSIRSPERPYNGPSRPTHPYGMYTQETADEPQVNPLAASADITSAGFPGHGQRYARRLGPDGEEADDLIGPDGHTEQLPPYTRYPEGAVPKERAISPIAEAFAPDSSQRPETESSSSGTLIGTEAASSGQQSDQTTAREEIQGTKEKWVEKGKRRTCFGRLPVWAVVLILAIVVIAAAVVGGLIGRLLGPAGNHHQPQHHPMYTEPSEYPESASVSVYVVTTTLSDAIPLATTPGNLQPIPTGNYALPIAHAPDRSSDCLSQLDQVPAWACMEEGLMTFDVSTSADNKSLISLDSAPPIKAHGLHYGAQPPSLKHPAVMELMQDVNKQDYGPAYYFCKDYDKLVILPHDVFPVPASASLSSSASSSPSSPSSSASPSPSPTPAVKVKARGQPLSERGFPMRGRLWPGQQPWYCWWNSTYLEGFIYVQQQSNTTDSDVQHIISDLNNYATITSTPSTAATPTQAAPTSQPYRFRPRHHGDDDDDDDGGYPPPPPPPYPFPIRKEASGDGDGDGDDSSYTYTPIAMPSPPPLYPLAVKLEERRVAAAPEYKPYCELRQVLDDWTVNAVPDPNTGKPIQISIDEIEPQQKRAVYEAVYGSMQRRDGGPGNGCMCEWLSS